MSTPLSRSLSIRVSAVPAMKWMPFRLHQTIHQELDLASNISEKQLNQRIHLMPDGLRYLKFSAANREMHHHRQKKDGS